MERGHTIVNRIMDITELGIWYISNSEFPDDSQNLDLTATMHLKRGKWNSSPSSVPYQQSKIREGIFLWMFISLVYEIKKLNPKTCKTPPALKFYKHIYWNY